MSEGKVFGIILPHMRAFGGVRRFLEVGTQLTLRGHQVLYFVGEKSDLNWFGSKVRPRVRSWNETPYNVDIMLIGDPTPQCAGKLSHVASHTHVFFWVIAGGDYLKMYRKIYETESDRLHFLLNNRVFLKYFPDKSFLCEGGVNTRLFRIDRKLKVGYYAGRGRIKGEPEIINALKDLPHIKLMPIEGMTSPELVKKYQELDYFVAWETREGWSNTAAEALSCGVSVVSNGRNVEPFANRVITVDDLKQFFSEPMADYSWQVVTDKLEKIFLDVGAM